jgi:hypothetical protein
MGGRRGGQLHDLERADTAVWPRLNNLSARALVGSRPTNDRQRQWPYATGEKPLLFGRQ